MTALSDYFLWVYGTLAVFVVVVVVALIIAGCRTPCPPVPDDEFYCGAFGPDSFRCTKPWDHDGDLVRWPRI